jgi:hypothetical protein
MFTLFNPANLKRKIFLRNMGGFILFEGVRRITHPKWSSYAIDSIGLGIYLLEFVF